MGKYSIGLLVLDCFACNKGPEPIQYGKDQGAYCKMTIADQQFGAEIVSVKGRIYKFDAIECMILYIKENKPELSHILATPYNKPSLGLISKDSLVFVIDSSIKSPMGANLAAFSSQEAVDSLLGKEIKRYSWEE